MLYKVMAAAVAAAAVFVSCSEEEGTDPGSDALPMVTLYQYAVEAPYNPDSDVRLRLALNGKVENLYYLAEKTEDHDSNVGRLGEKGYEGYVVENGTKVDVSGGEHVADVVLTGLLGSYTITAVAAGGGATSSASATFIGVVWERVKGATSQMNIFTGEEVETELQYSPTTGKYRIADPWGTGVSIVFSWDGSGESVIFESSLIATGWMHPDYGEVTFVPSSSGSFYHAPDEESPVDAFQFAGEWTVSAGSFGEAAGIVYLHD